MCLAWCPVSAGLRCCGRVRWVCAFGFPLWFPLVVCRGFPCPRLWPGRSWLPSATSWFWVSCLCVRVRWAVGRWWTCRCFRGTWALASMRSRCWWSPSCTCVSPRWLRYSSKRRFCALCLGLGVGCGRLRNSGACEWFPWLLRSCLALARPFSRSLSPAQCVVIVLVGSCRWCGVLLVAGVGLVLCFSRFAYCCGRGAACCRCLCARRWRFLWWFWLLCSLLWLVVLGLLLVAGFSSGLLLLSLAMVVRVVFLALVWLWAALFVVVRCGAVFRIASLLATLVGGGAGLGRLPFAVVRRAFGWAFSLLRLAWLLGVVFFVLAFLHVLGFRFWWLADCSRSVWRVFAGGVSFGLALPAFLLGFWVGLFCWGAVFSAVRRSVSLSFPLAFGSSRLLFVLVLLGVGCLGFYYL
ncbi:hypothetical protein SAMN04515620_101284 [Collimonas sp. OK607]|nr:hypothetical protein SAMN04515620_101284 [Collimonas sp. OK607]